MSGAAIETERLSKLYPGGHGIAELAMAGRCCSNGGI